MAADSKNKVLKKPELPDVQTLERVVKKRHERREYLRILPQHRGVAYCCGSGSSDHINVIFACFESNGYKYDADFA